MTVTPTRRVSLYSRAIALEFVAIVLCVLFALPSDAGVLPDDRADVLYHRYDGGGVTIHGPSVLVRKKLAEKYSVSANYYMDMVTSASIDVEVSGASEYKEERTQYELGLDYLRGKTTYTLSYTDSKENDYQAKTASFNISQDLFGDLTTVTLGYSHGDDIVRRRDPSTQSIDPTFEQEVARDSYRLGVSQILTKNMTLSLGYEAITDEGFLNNPYRSIRFLDETGAQGFAREIYPRTRTSNAASVSTRYFLPYRAAVHGRYRFFTDTWGIGAHTAEIGYVHPLKSPWVLEISYRHYIQTHADFYNDLFPRANFQNFMARDKELSSFTSQALHVGASYEFLRSGWWWIKKGSLNLFVDRIEFQYDDFLDARESVQGSARPGTEETYSFGANVFQFFVSVWF